MPEVGYTGTRQVVPPHDWVGIPVGYAMARRAKPWYRAAEDSWYASMNGRQFRLGVHGRENEAEAWRVWSVMRAGNGATAPPQLPQPQPPAVPPVAFPAAGGGAFTAPGPVVKVGDVVAAFLDDAAGRVYPETLETYRHFLLPFAKQFRGLPATAVAPTTAEAYSRKPNWGDSTRASFLAVLVRAFRHAERARLIDRTPLTGLRKPHIASRAADVLIKPEEHVRLLAAAPAPFRLFLQVLHGTGCRPGEAAKVEARDIDWEAGTVVIRQHKTARHGKRRVLYLTPAVVELLRPLAEEYPAGPLLRNRIGDPWTRSAIGMAIRKVCRKAGVSRKMAYGYRHTYATDALAGGVPDAVVAELLGHSGTAMLHKHYSHLATRGKVLSEAARKVR